MGPEFSQPDPSVIFDLLEGFRRSKTMFAAVSLGVFDTLEKGPRAADSLAMELKLDAVHWSGCSTAAYVLRC